jgi:hypothetical protein
MLRGIDENLQGKRVVSSVQKGYSILPAIADDVFP